MKYAAASRVRVAVGTGLRGVRPNQQPPARAARRLEDWLNKYGDADRIPAPGFAVKQEGESIDAMIARLEELVKRQYERGGVTANAKDAIDRALDAVHEKLRKRTEW